MRTLLRVALTAAALAGGSWAYAVPTTYIGSDTGAGSASARPNADAAAAAFDLAAAPFALIAFESAPLGSFASLAVAADVTLTGSDINGMNQTIRDSPLCGNLCGFNSTASGKQFAQGFGGSLTFTFASPIHAFGFYISGLQVAGETVTFNDGSPQSVSIPNLTGGGIAFVGFTNASGFSDVTLTFINIVGVSDIVGVDDVRYSAPAASIAEPATLALLGSGLAGIALYRRKKA